MVEEQPGSKTFECAASWVQTCKQHPECASASNLLPTRVVNVSDGQEEGSVRLVEPPRGTYERYAALGHCWGFSGLPTTTKANKADRMKAISLDEMSRSFKDAIHVARFLKIRYIWIASLCICQNDRDDWQRESATMGSVYSNAFLTISIMGAEDGSIEGFGNRKEREYVQLPYTHTDGTQGYAYAFALSMEKEYETDKYVSMIKEPLSSRAWCFQESVLSRRILHFARDQLYFECMQGIRNEEGLCLSDRYFSIHGSGGMSLLFNGYEPPDPTHLETWYGMLWDYGDRKLTKSSDKLPAFGGIAEIYAEKLNDQYLAGLWRKSLIQGLMWKALSNLDPCLDRPPSWSWASIDATPGHILRRGGWEPLACILDCHVEQEHDNPFGEVKSGWIKMEAPLVPVTLIMSEYRPDDPGTGVPIYPSTCPSKLPEVLMSMTRMVVSTLLVRNMSKLRRWRESKVLCLPWRLPLMLGKRMAITIARW